ncbi:MAG: glycoside hydrolase family 16 protein [Lacipirellulaceae bacterium]
MFSSSLLGHVTSLYSQESQAAAVILTQEDVERYQLVWSDEFNRDGPPNPKHWTFERGFVRNQELQWYKLDNARCEAGLLVIEAKRERVENPHYDQHAKGWKEKRRYAEYCSASVTTRGLHSWKFARIEVRARIDARSGLWPAIWTVGDKGRWPDCGEIDIMEYYQGDILANACWSSGKKWKPIWDAVKKPVREFADPEWASKFHVWRMDWDENQISLYVDDTLLNEIDLDQVAKSTTTQRHPFHQPHHLLLNLAVGGNHGGDPSKTKFPGKFEVDYVRVYQDRAGEDRR